MDFLAPENTKFMPPIDFGAAWKSGTDDGALRVPGSVVGDEEGWGATNDGLPREHTTELMTLESSTLVQLRPIQSDPSSQPRLSCMWSSTCENTDEPEPALLRRHVGFGPDTITSKGTLAGFELGGDPIAAHI